MDTITPVDELLFGLHSTIEQPGDSTIVRSRRGSHPELVVVGLPDSFSAEVLNRLATRVDAGE